MAGHGRGEDKGARQIQQNLGVCVTDFYGFLQGTKEILQIVACEEQKLSNLVKNLFAHMVEYFVIMKDDEERRTGFEFVNNLTAENALNNVLMGGSRSIMLKLGIQRIRDLPAEDEYSIMLKLGIQIIRDLPAEDGGRTNETEETSDDEDEDDEDSEDGDDEDEQQEGERTQPPIRIPIYQRNGNQLDHIIYVDSYDCYSYDDFALKINRAWARINRTMPLTEVEVDIESAWPGRSIEYQYYCIELDYFVILPPSRGPWGEWFIQNLRRIILSN